MRHSKLPVERSWFSWLHVLWDRPLWACGLATALLLVGIAVGTLRSPPTQPRAAEPREPAERDLSTPSEPHITSAASGAAETPQRRAASAQHRAPRESTRRDPLPAQNRASAPRATARNHMTPQQRRERREARRRERARERADTSRSRQPAPYAPQDLAAGGSPTNRDAVEDNAGAAERSSDRTEPREKSVLQKQFDDHRGRVLMNAGRYAAETGRCDRALYLYSIAVTETEVDLQPMAAGITPCFPALLSDPGAHPALANAFGIPN